MKNVTHLFFDLDHTLWDTDRNSKESLGELFEELEFTKIGIPSFDEFHARYREHNERLWGLYAGNQVGKDAVRLHRFVHTLQDFGIHDHKHASNIADKFIGRARTKQHLIPGAKKLLDHLNGKYRMSIITNGFPEVQYIKLKSSGIDHFFEHVFISEEIGVNKPDPAIYHHAVKTSGANHIDDCIMIGDTFQTDIMGAIAAGMKSLHYTQDDSFEVHASVTRVKSLDEIIEVLQC